MALTDTTITVQALPPSGNPNIDFYKAVVGPAKECTVAASASSLQCTIDELAPGATYEVALSACMPDAVGCGSPVRTEVKTKYPGRLMVHSGFACVTSSATSFFADSSCQAYN